MVIAVCSLARSGWAQAPSQIIGTIRGANAAPIGGATVTLTLVEAPEVVRKTDTDNHGDYRFSDVASGIYELSATHPDFQTATRQMLRLRLGSTLTVDLNLASEQGALVHHAPVVDVASPTRTTHFAREDLENLPFAALSVLPSLTPGATSRSAFGAAPDANQFMIGGTATVLTFHGGAAGAAFHPYWIDEAQIVSSGAGADAGEFTGVLTNVRIRSGTNRFAGLVEYRITPPPWVADNTGKLPEALQEQFRPGRILSQWGTIQQVGGPIVRDRVFFFTGFHFNRSRLFQAGTLGDVPREFRWPTVVTRLSAVGARNLRLEGYYLRDAFHVTGALGRNQLPETAGDNETPVQSWSERLTWTPTPGTLVELRNNGLDLEFVFLPASRRGGPSPRRDRITQILSGNAATFGDEIGRRVLTGADITQLVDAVPGGSHQLRAGIEHDRLSFRSVSGFPGGRSFTDAAGAPEQVVLWAGDTIASSGRRTTFYVQDRWKTAGRLSIDAGARVAFNRGDVPDTGTVFRTSPVSPRLGLAWDVGPGHRTVIRVNYGRYHEGLYPSVYDFLDTSGLSPRITARVLGPDTFQELTRSATTTVGLDDGVAHAYLEQYGIGAEHELFPSVSLSAQYVRRNFKDIWAFIDRGSRFAPVQRPDPGPDGRLGTADDGPLLTVFDLLNPGQSFPVLTNPSAAFRQHDAVQLIGEKHLSRNWQLLAGYTWSRTRGTVNAASQENRANGADTARGGVFFNPNRALNADGLASVDFPHQVNVRWTYVMDAWGGINLSGSYRYLSGGAWGRVATITGLAQGNQNVRVEPRGTRRLDASAVLDLRVEKTVRLGSHRTAGLYVDIFNVMNEGVALAVQEVSGAIFGQPTQWSSARTAQVAARFRF